MIECEYENNKRDVRKNSASVSQAKKSAKNKQFGGIECDLTYIGKWQQMAFFREKLAYDLYACKQMG